MGKEKSNKESEASEASEESKESQECLPNVGRFNGTVNKAGRGDNGSELKERRKNLLGRKREETKREREREPSIADNL